MSEINPAQNLLNTLQILRAQAQNLEIAPPANAAPSGPSAFANLFPSVWNTNVEASFRQPLLQGAGVRFNRIAGPGNVPGSG